MELRTQLSNTYRRENEREREKRRRQFLRVSSGARSRVPRSAKKSGSHRDGKRKRGGGGEGRGVTVLLHRSSLIARIARRSICGWRSRSSVAESNSNRREDAEYPRERAQIRRRRCSSLSFMPSPRWEGAVGEDGKGIFGRRKIYAPRVSHAAAQVRITAGRWWSRGVRAREQFPPPPPVEGGNPPPPPGLLPRHDPSLPPSLCVAVAVVRAVVSLRRRRLQASLALSAFRRGGGGGNDSYNLPSPPPPAFLIHDTIVSSGNCRLFASVAFPITRASIHQPISRR